MKKSQSMDTAGNVQGRVEGNTVTISEPIMNLVPTSASAMNAESALLKSAPAANSDRLANVVQNRPVETTGGWDSYEVWRRFIKDARDRRERTTS